MERTDTVQHSPQIPERIETERLYLRPYRAGDGPMYYAVSRRNRAHLARYEAGNIVMEIESEQDAEAIVRQLGNDWQAGKCFFMGAFDNETDAFVAQIYIGPVNWDVPEFALGYFVDVDCEGQGYVTEAARAALGFVFDHLGAHRVRLECDDTNLRSRRVAERCGFILEGHIRQNKRTPDGALSGTLHFGLLKDEFAALRTAGATRR
jgi:RimJ/RimL family protein N-acetyltransferase